MRIGLIQSKLYLYKYFSQPGYSVVKNFISLYRCAHLVDQQKKLILSIR